jgi:hypothetical protein
VTPLATPLILVCEACLWSWTKELALLSYDRLAIDRKRLGVSYICGLIDDTNHARLAMVVLVLCTIEGDGIGVLDSHGKGWLARGLARSADQESGVESTIGLAGSTGASSSWSNGMVLRRSVRVDQEDQCLAYSGDPDKLDSVTNGGSDGSGREDSQSTSANLDLVGGSRSGGNASRSSNDRLGEMHVWRLVL